MDVYVQLAVVKCQLRKFPCGTAPAVGTREIGNCMGSSTSVFVCGGARPYLDFSEEPSDNSLTQVLTTSDRSLLLKDTS